MKSLKSYVKIGTRNGNRIKKYDTKNGNNGGPMPIEATHHLKRICGSESRGSAGRKYENGDNTG
jgi:hypothetical protein